MDPSKELNKLFHKMQHTDRTDEARRNSLLKLQDKVRRKKRPITPIFISVAMVAVVFFFIFTLINKNSPFFNDFAVRSADEDKNKIAVQAVLEKEFTGPDKGYIRLMNDPKNITISRDGEIISGPEQGVETELDKYIADLYKPYFTAHGYEKFKPLALDHHFIAENSHFNASEIKVTQSENSPKNYHFIVQVEYENPNGEVTQHEVKGMMICTEEGKIGRVKFRGDGGLSMKMREHLNK